MGAELDDAYPIPLMVLQNENDCTVIKTSDDNIRDAHLKAFGDPAFDTPAEANAESTACSPYYQNNYGCTRTRYTQDGTSGSPASPLRAAVMAAGTVVVILLPVRTGMPVI